jgi:hypothetical protein
VAADPGDGDPLDLGVDEGLADLVQLLFGNDGGDELHRCS